MRIWHRALTSVLTIMCLSSETVRLLTECIDSLVCLVFFSWKYLPKNEGKWDFRDIDSCFTRAEIHRSTPVVARLQGR